MNAIVTVVIGNKYERIAEVTHPSLKKYAKSVDAEFICISNKSSGQEDIVPHFAKLQCYNLFDKYDRILFLDSDIIIRDDCPNLFDLVPVEKIGAFMEGQFIPRRKMDLEMASRTYSTPIIGIKRPEDWKGEYWNTGVLLVSKCHKTIFTPPDFEKMRQVEGAWDYGEQGWLNLQIINGCIQVHNLSHRFNRMSIMDDLSGEHRLQSFIVHYAGAPEVIKTSTVELDISELIQRDLLTWQACNGDYSKFKRGIYIRVGGGLGDQIDAEPVVRKIVNEYYKDCDILIACDWPRVFDHLETAKVCKVDDIEKTISQDQAYYKMETLPIPESVFGAMVSHPLVHSTDYSSLSCLRRILDPLDKGIKLRTSIQDVNNLSEKIGIDGVKELTDMVAIHCGRGWISKTFPLEWWQEVVNQVSEIKRVCLIGKDIGDDQGLVNVECPKSGLDLRNKTSIGELFLTISATPILISNDSSPIHIAGAFDNWIIAIPTCKHPHHILPWRNGTQEYKTKALYKKLLVDHICNLPTEIYGQTIDWIPNNKKLPLGTEIDYKNQLKGGNILDYLPEPVDVANSVKEILNVKI